MLWVAPSNGFGPTPMPKIAIVAALQREIFPLIKNWTRIQREYQGHRFTFFEQQDRVAVCGGIGIQAARRATEAIIALYHPAQLRSVGFAGALNESLQVGDIFSPALVIDARDGSRHQLEGGDGTLVTFMAVAGAAQKSKLAEAYGASAVDMEAAAVAAVAHTRGITFGATKAISDDVDFEMASMASFINSEGQFKTANFALFATIRPWLWKSLAMLARNSRKASQALCAHLEDFRSEMPRAAVTPKTASPSVVAAENPLAAKGGK
jgi:adenosylhomocysteine nucleosidase